MTPSSSPPQAHLTYNCALEEHQDRCAAVFEALASNPALDVVARDTWEQAAVRPYRIRPAASAAG